jgi:WD40 repeat protein
MHQRMVCIFGLLLFASLLFCSGCENAFLDVSAAGSGKAPQEEWATYGEFRGYGQGIESIAVCPERSGDTNFFDPFIATTNGWLLRTGERGGCMGGPPIGSVKLWGPPLEGLELMSISVPWRARDLRFTPNGLGLAYTCQDGVVIRHIDERRFETRVAANDKTRFELSTDCRWIVQFEYGEQQKTLTVLDFETTEPHGKVTFRSDWRQSCHVSDDGNQLSVILHDREPISTTAVVFNLATGTPRLAVPIDSDTGTVAWSASGNILAAENSTDDITQIWDMTKGELRCTAGKQSKIRCVAISPDERLVITGGEGQNNGKAAGEAVIWDAQTGRELGRHWDESSWGVTALAVTEKGMLMIGNGDGYVILKKIPDRILAQVAP